MRRLILISISGLVWLASGCTASDRDYVRNHVVHLDSSRQLPISAQPVLAPDSALQRR